MAARYPAPPHAHATMERVYRTGYPALALHQRRRVAAPAWKSPALEGVEREPNVAKKYGPLFLSSLGWAGVSRGEWRGRGGGGGPHEGKRGREGTGQATATGFVLHLTACRGGPFPFPTGGLGRGRSCRCRAHFCRDASDTIW